MASQEIATTPVSAPSLVGWQPPSLITSTEVVSEARNPRWRVRALTESQRVEIEAALGVLRLRLQPAEPKAIVTLLIGLSNHFKKDRSDAEWRALAHDYVDDLREYSAVQISEAIREWRRAKPFFPKIADLISILEPKACKDRENLRRTRVLLGLESPNCIDLPIAVDEPGKVRDLRPVFKLLAGVGR